MRDFGGEKLNFIQIGLGTNATFIQNLAGSKEESNNSIRWLLTACSEADPQHVRGIAVEPVLEILDELRPKADRLPGVQVVHAALGESEASGVEMQGLSLELRDKLLEKVPPSKRAKLTADLEYVRNMSCFDGAHPLLPMCRKSIEYEYDINFDIGSLQKVDIWPWSKLAKTFNFVGCEVVLIDTEGYDTKILRSLLSYCRDHPDAWPEIIQFETMGHCDRREGLGAEKEVIAAFEMEGYTLVGMSDHNTHLISKEALWDNKRLKKWLNSWFCYACFQNWACPYVTVKQGIFCKECFDFFVEKEAVKGLKMGVELDDLTNHTPTWGKKRPLWKDEWKWKQYERWTTRECES